MKSYSISEKIPSFWKPKVLYSVLKNPSFNFIVSYFNTVRTFNCVPLRPIFIVILPFTNNLVSKWSFPVRVPNQNKE